MESNVRKTQPPQHLKTGTNKGIGQETHTQTNRAIRHRRNVNLQHNENNKCPRAPSRWGTPCS